MDIHDLLREGMVALAKHEDKNIRHDAHLESELLLAHALGTTRTFLMIAAKKIVTPSTEKIFRALLKRRAAHEPVAYLIGKREFFGVEFITKSGALIPRPETELLIELVLEHIKFCSSAHCFVDVGTGSGAIACVLAKNTGEKVFATELSPIALTIAKENVKKLGLTERVELMPGNALIPVLGKNACKRADEIIIIANLPYLPTKVWEESMPDVRDFEPREALDGGADGLDSYRVLLNQLTDVISTPDSIRGRNLGSVIGFFEIDPSQVETLPQEILKRFPKAQVVAHKDLAGLDRALACKIATR